MYRENPFGNPDGARADLKEIEHSFITEYPYGLCFKRDLNSILNKRVIVGAKGSGKTVYLRKIQSILKERMEKNSSIYVDDSIEQNLNCTDRVIKYCDLFPKKTLSEKWCIAWQITILLTLANKFLFNPVLKNYVSDEDRKSLLRFMSKTILVTKDDLDHQREYSLYSFFQILLYAAETRVQTNKILEDRGWFWLKDTLIKVLRKSPEVYLFLDSIDSEYEHAPLHWLMCQKGLFYAVLSFLQQGILGEKLHLIITLRDNVFTSILRSEHATKYCNENHIFPLTWNKTNIESFLSQKVSALDNCYFISDIQDKKDIASWLSISTIQNEYGNNEDIASFIIRHTRLVPRDLIIVCNELAKLHLEIVSQGKIDISGKIQKIVYKNSKNFGEELLTICAKNITANCMPTGAGQNDYSDGFTANQVYRENTYDKLIHLLSRIITKSRFSDEVIENLREAGEEAFGKDAFLLDVLWQNNVIAYIENGVSIYYGQDFNGDTLLPRGKKVYELCACVALKTLQ